MASLTQAQTSFIGGSIDPIAWGNTSSPLYQSSVKTLTNFDITNLGAVRKRPGSLYITTTKNQNLVGLISFQPSIDKGYVLEFGHLYIRFYKDGAQVQSGGSPLEVTTTYTSTDLANIQVETVENNIYLACTGVFPKILILNTNDTWTFKNYNTSPEPSIELGHFPNTTLTPGATTGTGVTFTAGSSVFLASAVGRHLINLDGNGAAVITAVAGTTCTADILSDFDSTSAIAANSWKLDKSPITTITPSGKDLGSKIDLTLAAAGWFSTDVGSYVSLNGGIVKITAYTSSTVVSGVILKKLNSTSTTRIWALEQLEWTSDRGYPTSVCLYEQRLCWGRDITIFGSAIGVYDDHGVLATDDSAIVFNIAQNNTNKIIWLKNSKALIVGTLAGIVSIGQENSMISASNPPKLINQSNQGTCQHRPVQVEDMLAYIGKDQKHIYLIKLSNTNDQKYDIIDTMQYAAHYTRQTTIKEIVYSSLPYSRIFAVLNDGNIIVGTITFDTKGNVEVSWSKYDTDGDYKSIAVVSTNTSSDNIYTAVHRDSLGDVLLSPLGVDLLSPGGYPLVSSESSDQAIEIFDTQDGSHCFDLFTDCSTVRNARKDIASITLGSPCIVFVTAHDYSTGNSVLLTTLSDNQEINQTIYTITVLTANSFSLDSTTGASSIPSSYCRLRTNTLTGLDQLEAESVVVKADGNVLANKTVSSGSITLDATTKYATATAGLGYTATLETLPKEIQQGQNGSYLGQSSRMAEPILYLYNSDPPTIVNDTPTPIVSANTTTIYQPAIYTQTLQYAAQGLTKDSTVLITHSRPLPLTILGIYGRSEGYQR